MRALFWIVCLLQCCAALAQPAPSCTRQTFDQTTNFSAQAMRLLYSQRNQRCDAADQGANRMQCGSAPGATYTTYSFAVATSGAQTPGQGVCARFNLSVVAPKSIGCYQYSSADIPDSNLPVDSDDARPPYQPQSFIDSVYMGFGASRTFVDLPASSIGSFTVPITWAQFQTQNDTANYERCPSLVVDNSTCGNAVMNGAPTLTPNINQCNADFIFSMYGDTSQTQQVYDNCGTAETVDFIGSIMPVSDQCCRAACCPACGTDLPFSQTTTSYREWPVGPGCQILELGTPVLQIYGGMVVSKNADLSDGEYIPFQTRVQNTDEPQFIGGLTTNRYYLSASGKVRAHVNAVRSDSSILQQGRGYLLVCNLAGQPNSGVGISNRTNVCDQGPGNPYAVDKEPSPCLSSFGDGSLADQVPPVITSTSSIPVGQAPSFKYRAPGAPCIFAFIPYDYVNAQPSLNQAQFSQPIKDQCLTRLLGVSGPDPITGGTTCPGQGSPYFVNYTRVPGWELDPATGLPLQVSPCQMFASINNYTNYVQQFYIETGSVAEALEKAAPASQFLNPLFNVGAANMWLTNGALRLDLGLTFPSTQAIQLQVDLSDDMYIQNERSMYQYALDSASACYIDQTNGTGTLFVVVDGLAGASSTAQTNVLLNCSSADGRSVVLVSSATPNTTIPGTGVPVTTPANVVMTIDPILISFVPVPGYTSLTPYITCVAQLIDVQTGVQYGQPLSTSCARTDSIFAAKIVEEEQKQKSYLTIIVLSVIVGVGALALLVATIAIGVYVYRKKEAQDVLEESLKDK